MLTARSPSLSLQRTSGMTAQPRVPAARRTCRERIVAAKARGDEPAEHPEATPCADTDVWNTMHLGPLAERIEQVWTACPGLSALNPLGKT